jgi:hypothetical protein
MQANLDDLVKKSERISLKVNIKKKKINGGLQNEEEAMAEKTSGCT